MNEFYRLGSIVVPMDEREEYERFHEIVHDRWRHHYRSPKKGGTS
ncbi:hypothetical protein J2Z69_002593 [Paenibacillus shirakamiensis]|uniref:Uncharacterized protein n=1 Tax=Paenibacillus shirakamiensis TaxID=1265935 RepID=A0ABS4JIK1_9BACL|nr:hypothetical protein [Paenibacillus shirakamiensis]MBP2001548.1 hypothetical protein [Paenibacillus shirakamiensis]